MSKRYPHPDDMVFADNRALRAIGGLNDHDSKLCICGDCGRGFMKGEQGDNEEYCLRCQHQSATEGMDELERDDYDRMHEED
jgi:hypothetical protein